MRARSIEYLLNEAALALSDVDASTWDGHSLPVPIDAIAEDHFGLLVREVVDIASELAGREGTTAEHASAALIPELAEIWVDATEASRSPRRRRSAIAHELGHWQLHRGPDPALCSTAAIDPVGTVTHESGASPESWAWQTTPADPAVEWEANVFGGALLLPPWLVRKAWEERPSLDAIAETFDCSLPEVGQAWLRQYAVGTP